MISRHSLLGTCFVLTVVYVSSSIGMHGRRCVHQTGHVSYFPFILAVPQVHCETSTQVPSVFTSLAKGAMGPGAYGHCIGKMDCVMWFPVFCVPKTKTTSRNTIGCQRLALGLVCISAWHSVFCVSHQVVSYCIYMCCHGLLALICIAILPPTSSL